MQCRFKSIRNVLIGVLLLNWTVAIAKIVYGLMTRCVSMSADGFHSLADGTSNIIGLVGVSVASRPEDIDHPYGHKKYETLSAIFIAVLLFIISFNLLREVVMDFFKPHAIADVTNVSFIVMIATVAVNIGVYLYERMRAKQLNSDILAADSQHTRSDILVSLSVIATLIAIKSGIAIMDTIVSMAIAIFIAYGAFGILRETSNVLCDGIAIVSDEIKNIVLNIDGVKDCHNIRTRGRKDDIHVDLHVHINPNMHVETAHELTHKIQKVIKDKINGITDIAIHVEPYGKKQ